MAKFDDYKHLLPADNLETEIDEAAQQTAERREEDPVPERFKGKTKAEIAKAWEEADRALARQGQELGDLRRTVNALSEAQKKAAEQPRPAPKPVTMDELYETPDAAVRRVVAEESSSRIDELERQVQEANARVQIAEGFRVFETRHPTYKDTMKDPEFLEWIKSSAIRTQLAGLADAGNFDAADELFSTYRDIKQLRTQQQPPRAEAARAVALERSGGVSPAPEDTFSRNALQEKRIAAQRGDRVADRWLKANAEAIQSAYAEGRLTA